jgi:hypothetical protein
MASSRPSNTDKPNPKKSKVEAIPIDKLKPYFDELDQVQEKISQMQEQAEMEINQVRAKYLNLSKAHFQKRSEVIKKIPDFWKNAVNTKKKKRESLSSSSSWNSPLRTRSQLTGHPMIGGSMDETDVEICGFIDDLQVEANENGKVFKIIMVCEGEKTKQNSKSRESLTCAFTFFFFLFTAQKFKPNPYFSNQILSKEIHRNEKSVASPIQWKPQVSPKSCGRTNE